ncbi:MAG: hypothetical protein VX672_02165 [Planctomycetota bacterium]|nr:hypothetical protein [Planctomycetota bacterium]
MHMTQLTRAAVLVMVMAPAGSAAASDGVRNGSFTDFEQGGWMTSSPVLIRGTGSATIDLRAAEAWVLDVGHSILHQDQGRFPPQCVREEPCVEGLGAERLSVLRMWATHPERATSEGPPAPEHSLGGSELCVFQADIRVPTAWMGGEDAERVDLVLRFDHLGFHPKGGHSLIAALVAERVGFDGASYDWGGDSTGQVVLPFDDPPGAEPRERFELPLVGSSCPCLPEYCEPEAKRFRDGYRTEELVIALDALPGWREDDGVDQIEEYRFTVAFKLDQEGSRSLRADTLENCPEGDECDLQVAHPSDWKTPIWGVPGYGEIDQVVLLAACRDEDEDPCRFDAGAGDRGDCRATQWPDPQFAFGNWETTGILPLAWCGDPETWQPGVASEPVEWRREFANRPDLDEGHIVNACLACDETENQKAVVERLVRNERAPLARPITGVCLADLDGNGVVNGADLGLLFASWSGTSGPGESPPGDLDGDGVVSGNDLGLLLGAWGPCSDPCGR